MDELKPCLLPCNLEQLNDRINNLSAGLTSMSSKDIMRVNKTFLTEVLNYMEELLGLRREEENRRATPENKPLTLEQLKDIGITPIWLKGNYTESWAQFHACMGNKYQFVFCGANEQPQDFMLDDYGKTWLAYSHEPKRSEADGCTD